ncbi:centrosome-associated zinc finger protein CP190 [Polistes fuscatus]|uniref:centrosome-associated zinc finger protein CP190 n=1 Tax=Polistes fuscatus TaxID=30207 RepID=UPI001CA9694B|nr:centrosome-associated zinc finger protein CP190 [Polistes fuscatus]
MQASTNRDKSLPSRGLKQVKVDNWGTFFLQRLQQLYFEEELLDLTIKFPTSDITVQAHRLVITTCTDYFVLLERQLKEKDKNFDGVIIMPPDMPYECVKSIISFMYTGQLEYWNSEQHALYRTAQKMKMTVLTKLLDAHFNTTALQANRPIKSNTPIISKSTTLSTEGTVTTSASSTLSAQPLPGRKLPIWKRKLELPPTMPITNYELRGSAPKSREITAGPSRFDLPEADEFALGVFSSFDDITYNTKPIVQASGKYKRDRSPSLKCSPDRDVKNDSTEDEEDDTQLHEKDSKEINSDDDWTISNTSERSQDAQQTTKRVRFDLEEKENLEKSSSCQTNTDEAINNHAKIIREVLKKYPHLIKHNKNIRLKIMQKEAKSAETSAPCKTKVSYVVLKSDHLMSSSNGDENDSKCNGNIDGETGPWKCNKCDLEEEYTNYYMYRRHMQDVHEEKFDPRVCEHCGYKATKRNILMYHLYTKHNVPPPKSMCFPKCQACSYVALSETLLVKHQISYNHRPTPRNHPSNFEITQCLQCSQVFKDTNDLTTHEINTGHSNHVEGREKGYRCPHCSKTFVRVTNLQVHIDCSHKDLRDSETPAPAPPISLEPSSEAEALSHVASGIATSLGVGDSVSPETTEVENQSDFIVPEMQITDISQTTTYHAHEFEGQQMIMLINNDNYQQQDGNDHHQQPQQLDISGNEQIVMQGTEDGMIVYIHDNDETERQTYSDYQSIEITQEPEEIVEEVVEEVEEAVMEEEEVQEERSELIDENNVHQMEDGIQYVEEQTEIVEYDEEQCSEDRNRIEESQESVMIIEEEHVEGDDEVIEEVTEKENNEQQSPETRDFATEWDEYSRDAIE